MNTLQLKIEKSNPAETLREFRARKALGLHLVPTTLKLPELAYHGSTKDIRSHTEYFDERSILVDEFMIPRREERIADWLLYFHQNVRPLSEYRFILLDIPGTYPKTFRLMRRLAPKTQLMFRSHNAEFYHRLDWMSAEANWLKKAKFFKQAIQGLWGDYQTARVADAILPITDWDADTYWKKLVGKNRKWRIQAVPYFLPVSYCPSGLDSDLSGSKRNLCVSIGTVSKAGGAVHVGPLVESQYREFSKLVDKLPSVLTDNWEFALTGDVPSHMKLSSRIQLTGPLPSPFSILKEARVVCLLSEHGRGFKTKILDTLLSQAVLILHQDLYDRLPEKLRLGCIRFDPKSGPHGLGAALQKSLHHPTGRGINESLKEDAFRALDKIQAGFGSGVNTAAGFASATLSPSAG